MDWGAFWGASTAAATVATAISTGAVLWLQRRNRPEPEWVWIASARRLDGEEEYSADEERVHITCELLNAGDGKAFNVRLSGSGCSVGWGRRSVTVAPLVSPGDQPQLWASLKDPAWTTAVITLEWTRPPTRLRRRQRVAMAVADLGVEYPAGTVRGD